MLKEYTVTASNMRFQQKELATERAARWTRVSAVATATGEEVKLSSWKSHPSRPRRQSPTPSPAPEWGGRATLGTGQGWLGVGRRGSPGKHPALGFLTNTRQLEQQP